MYSPPAIKFLPVKIPSVTSLLYLLTGYMGASIQSNLVILSCAVEVCMGSGLELIHFKRAGPGLHVSAATVDRLSDWRSVGVDVNVYLILLRAQIKTATAFVAATELNWTELAIVGDMSP